MSAPCNIRVVLLLESPTADVADAFTPLLSPERERDDLAAFVDEQESRFRTMALCDALLARRGWDADTFEI